MEKAGEQTHQVSVVDGSRIAIMGKNSEEISKIPKLIVDGKEATQINSSLHSYIQNNSLQNQEYAFV